MTNICPFTHDGLMLQVPYALLLLSFSPVRLLCLSSHPSLPCGGLHEVHGSQLLQLSPLNMAHCLMLQVLLVARLLQLLLP